MSLFWAVLTLVNFATMHLADDDGLTRVTSAVVFTLCLVMLWRTCRQEDRRR